MAITPIDTVKTILQVDGELGLARLKERVVHHGMGVLYNGEYPLSYSHRLKRT